MLSWCFVMNDHVAFLLSIPLFGVQLEPFGTITLSLMEFVGLWTKGLSGWVRLVLVVDDSWFSLAPCANMYSLAAISSRKARNPSCACDASLSARDRMQARYWSRVSRWFEVTDITGPVHTFGCQIWKTPGSVALITFICDLTYFR